MNAFEKKRVLVIGTDADVSAAGRLLQRSGAVVSFSSDRGADQLTPGQFDFAVVGKASVDAQLIQQLESARVSVISDLELAFRQARCLTVAVAGNAGKSSAATLITQVLEESGRVTRIGGDRFTAPCDLVEQSHELDFLTLLAGSEQLLHSEFLRPSIAVLLNLGGTDSEIAAAAALLRNQQPFDWAVLQHQAYAELKRRNVPVRGKVITFSATEEAADIFLDRGLIISRIEEWAGPLLDFGQTQFRGGHFAENLMVALAISRVLRLKLEDAVAVLKRSRPLPHCCEWIGEVDGVNFINDARSSSVVSLSGALDSVPSRRGEANVWLIAGGDETALDYHSVGPLLSQRVKGAFLLGKSQKKLRGAWSLFTPCTLTDSLLEAVTQAAAKAVRGDTILFSPACSRSDLFQNDQHPGEVYRQQVAALGGTSRGGALNAEPKRLNAAL